MDFRFHDAKYATKLRGGRIAECETQRTPFIEEVKNWIDLCSGH